MSKHNAETIYIDLAGLGTAVEFAVMVPRFLTGRARVHCGAWGSRWPDDPADLLANMLDHAEALAGPVSSTVLIDALTAKAVVADAERYDGLTYYVVTTLTGKSRASIQRVAREGLLRKSPRQERPAAYNLLDVLIWHFGQRKLPARPVERERQALWRLLFEDSPGGGLPDTLPLGDGKSRSKELEERLPAVSLPMSQQYKALVSPLNARELRLLAGMLIANLQRVDRLPITKEDAQSILRSYAWERRAQGQPTDPAGLSPDMWQHYLPTPIPCPKCGAVGRGIIVERRQLKEYVDGDIRLKPGEEGQQCPEYVEKQRRQEDDDDERPSPPDTEVTVKCRQCGHVYSFTYSQLRDAAAMARDTRDVMNRAAGVRIEKADYEANRRMVREESRTRTGRYCEVRYTDTARVLQTTGGNVRRSYSTACKRLGSTFTKAFHWLFALHKEILMLHYGAHFRWAFPGLVTTMIDAYLLRLDAELGDRLSQASNDPSNRGVTAGEVREHCISSLVEQRMTDLRMALIAHVGQTTKPGSDH